MENDPKVDSNQCVSEMRLAFCFHCSVHLFFSATLAQANGRSESVPTRPPCLCLWTNALLSCAVRTMVSLASSP